VKKKKSFTKKKNNPHTHGKKGNSAANLGGSELGRMSNRGEEKACSDCIKELQGLEKVGKTTFRLRREGGGRTTVKKKGKVVSFPTTKSGVVQVERLGEEASNQKGKGRP